MGGRTTRTVYFLCTGNYRDVVVAHFEDLWLSPDDAGRADVYSWMILSASVSGNFVELQWSSWPTAT
jgi:hypothetical protein